MTTSRRAGARHRLATGIYRDKSGVSIIISVQGRSSEHRAPVGMSLPDLKRLRARLRLESSATAPPTHDRGTLAHDIERYLAMSKHLVCWSTRRGELRHWVQVLGARRTRYSVKRSDVLDARSRWLSAGTAPKTVNNRVVALRALWTALDGPEAPCPADRIRALSVPRQPPSGVATATISAVYQALLHAERTGRLKDSKIRARFRMLAETGRRPSEIMRIQPTDFDLERGVWHVRDGKGGFTPGGVFMTAAVREAVEEFIAADAFGCWQTNQMARTLRAVGGWPKGVRPYTLRHTLGMALADAGADHMDIAAVLGHRDPRITREHYIGTSASRTRAALERVGERFAWTKA